MEAVAEPCEQLADLLDRSTLLPEAPRVELQEDDRPVPAEGGGDALSVQGPLKASIYLATDGSTKVSLSIVAICVLALRAAPKERKAKAAAPFDDEIGSAP